jgi:hypothetical protein
MTERRQAGPDFDTRLAEFDRRLRAIQADLAPGRKPAPARPPRRHGGRSGPLAELLEHSPPPPRAERPPHPEPQPSADLAELAALMASLREVLEGIEALLDRIVAGGREATIAAGPFQTLEEVREFERGLSSVPGVRDVSVRGYEGAARAIIDVHLGGDH